MKKIIYPNDLDYKSAVESCFYPPDNGGYIFKPELNEGEVVFSSGGKAIVFKVYDEKDNKTKALKLFTFDDTERFIRFKQITQSLKKIKSNFFVDIIFVPKIIYVNIKNQDPEDNYFPGIVMSWADGVTLGTKLKELIELKDLKNIKKIANNFKNLSTFLINSKIGHGDLKHDNIIVNDRLEMVLVDYDGMYVKELSGLHSTEEGTDSFQHPKRSVLDFNSRIDEFSILIIYTSLLALSKRPELYNQFNVQQNILFTKEDFLGFENSLLFKELDSIVETKKLAFFIKKALQSDTIYIDDIQNYLNAVFPKPSIIINQSVPYPVVGQTISIKWETKNADFLNINGSESALNGTFALEINAENNLLFQYGTNIENIVTNYSIKGLTPPAFHEFTASNYDLKFDEPLVLSWKVSNAKKVLLSFNQEEVDVTDKNSHTIPSLVHDSTFKLTLEAESNNFTVQKDLSIKVYYPVTLDVKQDLNIVYSNRPVKLDIRSTNAEQIILTPGNENLLGKPTYMIRVAESSFYKVVASNKRYYEEFESFIDVIKAPLIDRKVIELPPINLSLPPLFLKIPPIKETLNNVGTFDRKVIKVNRFLNKLNIFKITINKLKL